MGRRRLVTALAIVQIEGVLAKVNFELKAARPTLDGMNIWTMVKRVYKTAIVTATDDRENAAAWLKRNGFTGYDLLDAANYTIQSRPDALFLADDMISAYRAQGWEIGPYITSNPVVAARALKLGATAWLIASPLYMRPEHRPDAERGPRAWEALVDEVEQQQIMKAEDKRLEAEDVIGGAPND